MLGADLWHAALVSHVHVTRSKKEQRVMSPKRREILVFLLSQSLKSNIGWS